MNDCLFKSNSRTVQKTERVGGEKNEVEDEIGRKVREIMRRECTHLQKSSRHARSPGGAQPGRNKNASETTTSSAHKLPVLIEKTNMDELFKKEKYLFNVDDFLKKRESREIVFDLSDFKTASPSVINPDPSKPFKKLRSKNYEHYFHSVLTKVENSFGRTTEEERLAYACTHTREGLMKALKTGRFLDGSRLLKEAGRGFKTQWGFTFFKDGPFWPPDLSPLHPTPHHIWGVKEAPQAVGKVNTEDGASGVYRRRMVYDYELSPKYASHDFSQRHQHLQFESRFESGNLARVFRTEGHEYELHLRQDLNTSGHLQWFYFRVRGMVCGVVYQFKIINLTKSKCLHLEGLKPLFYSEKEAEMHKMGWRRVGEDLAFHKTHPTLKKPHYTFKWSQTFPHHGDTCYLAHCYPYTFTDLQHHLHNIRENKHLRVHPLCSTLAGNTCHILSISENYRSNPVEGKRIVLITARVHPGETNSSHVVHAITLFLLSDHKLARDLRKMFIFKVIPMLNPDGVIVGNYRCSLLGVDLNRRFCSPSPHLHPPIFHLKLFVSQHIQDIFFYCDLHGHNVKNDIFMYGCPSAEAGEKHLEAMLLPWMMSKQMPDKFSFRSCTFEMGRSKLGTGRCVFRKQLSIFHSYTFETSFCGSQSTREHFTKKDYEHFGREFCLALRLLDKTLLTPSLKQRFYEEIKREITREKLNKENEGMLEGATSVEKQDGDNSSSNEEEEEEDEYLKSILYRRIIKNKEKMERRTSKKRSFELKSNRKFEYNNFKDKNIKMKDKNIKMEESKSTTTLEGSSKVNNDATCCNNLPPPRNTTSPHGWRGRRWKGKYDGRHNRGIPCFVTLRLLERNQKSTLPALE